MQCVCLVSVNRLSCSVWWAIFGRCGGSGLSLYMCFGCVQRLLPCVKNNVGFVFTQEDLVEVRDLLISNKVSIQQAASFCFPAVLSLLLQMLESPI